MEGAVECRVHGAVASTFWSTIDRISHVPRVDAYCRSTLESSGAQDRAGVKDEEQDSRSVHFLTETSRGRLEEAAIPQNGEGKPNDAQPFVASAASAMRC